MVSSSAPLVSIGLPTYNRATWLPQAIQSALGQTYPNVEVVLSDNASTDGTAEICRDVAARDSRFRYIRQPVNRGAAENFATVLRESRGQYFMWLGDDDWLDLDYVARCVEVLTADPRCSLVCGLARYYAGDQLIADDEVLDLTSDSPSERVLGYLRAVRRNGVFYGIMPRDLITRITNADALGGDWLMIASMAYLGRIRTLPDTHVHRSVAGGSGDWETLLGMFKMSKFGRANPYMAIAGALLSDIGWRSPIYQPMGSALRLALALRAARVIITRHYSRGALVRMIPQVLSAAYAGK